MDNMHTADSNKQQPDVSALFGVIRNLLITIIVLVIGLVSIPLYIMFSQPGAKTDNVAAPAPVSAETRSMFWVPADIGSITDAAMKTEVAYGRELIAHTAKYLGPRGSVAAISNGMNCQNCHLQAGTAVFGNNYGSVASLYPKFRARSGSVETITKRVNDCIERSLNGKPLDSAGREMNAIRSYISYIGSNVPHGSKAEGSGLKELPYLDRAADPEKGRVVYQAKCASCHQSNGEGLSAGEEYSYPPLWGPHSYNDAAGLFRLSNFARYVKFNMPQGTTHENPQLSDEESWDLAAFVNSQPRPHKDTPGDWPDISKKPVDHPFGPYADGFSERQHKYGPFKPIADAQKKGASASSATLK